MFDKLGGRKLLVTILFTAMGLGITALKGDIPANLLQLMEVLAAAFMGTNVAAGLFAGKGVAVTGTVPDAPEEPTAPATPTLIEPAHAVEAFQQLGQLIQQNSADQKAMLTELSKSTQVTQQALSVVVNKLVS